MTSLMRQRGDVIILNRFMIKILILCKSKCVQKSVIEMIPLVKKLQWWYGTWSHRRMTCWFLSSSCRAWSDSTKKSISTAIVFACVVCNFTATWSRTSMTQKFESIWISSTTLKYLDNWTIFTTIVVTTIAAVTISTVTTWVRLIFGTVTPVATTTVAATTVPNFRMRNYSAAFSNVIETGAINKGMELRIVTSAGELLS